MHRLEKWLDQQYTDRCGTNRHEALHQHINPTLTNKCIIGLPLDLALFTILLYRHNIGRYRRKVKLSDYNETQSQNCSTLYHYGVHKKCTQDLDLSWITSDVKNNCLDLLELNFTNSLIHVSLQEDALKLVTLEDIESAVNLTQYSNIPTLFNSMGIADIPFLKGI